MVLISPDASSLPSALKILIVIGPVNVAYLFALSQFFMAWLIAFLYVRAANRFDRMAATVLANLERRKREQSKDQQRG